MAQTNFTAADMYPKAVPAPQVTEEPKVSVSTKKAKKTVEPVAEAPVVEEVVEEEAPKDSE